MTASASVETVGRRRRFERLFDAHHRAVLGYALRRTDDAHDAADVVSETFLVAWRRLGDIPAGAEAAWLFGVARKVRANQRRGAQRRTDLSARLGETLRAELAARDHATTASTAADAVMTALGSLSADDREILMLSAWEGLEPSEIATALGLRGSTARSRLRRARARLEAAIVTADPTTTVAAPDADAPSPSRADRALSLAEDHPR